MSLLVSNVVDSIDNNDDNNADCDDVDASNKIMIMMIINNYDGIDTYTNLKVQQTTHASTNK